jgi:hypothetical protein
MNTNKKVDVPLANMASGRALSLATIETPFFGLDFRGYVDPRVAYWINQPLHEWLDNVELQREKQMPRLTQRSIEWWRRSPSLNAMKSAVEGTRLVAAKARVSADQLAGAPVLFRGRAATR